MVLGKCVFGTSQTIFNNPLLKINCSPLIFCIGK